MTRRKCIKTLQRRAEHLEKRIKNAAIPLTYDVAELTALYMAIDSITNELKESEEYYGTISTI